MQRINQTGIYDGNDCWPEQILAGGEWTAIGEKTCFLYKNMPESMYESLLNSQRRYPDKCCIVDDSGTAYTYTRVLQLVDEFAKVLYNTYHVNEGMHIGVLLYNSIEFCIAIYAINRVRAVAVPLSTKYKQPETLSLIEKADLDGIVYHNDFAQWFSDKGNKMFLIELDSNKDTGLPDKGLLPEIPLKLSRADEYAIMMFTSGTTSYSKGVLMRNFNVMHAIAVYQRIFGITHNDRTVLPVPAYHVTGLIAVMGLFVHAGGCIWLHKFFNAPRVLMEIEKNHITFLHASPTVFSLLLEYKNEYPELPDLKVFACGSGNMPVRKIREIKEWLPQLEFRTVYGLTETSSPATIFPEGMTNSNHIGSSGLPVPGTQFKICDDDGNVLPPLVMGTIMIKGTNVTNEYYKPKETAAGSSIIEDEWLDTGDIGYFDKENYLYIVDRKKDMINRGGEKVCSYDVENVLYNIPGIREAAVVGIPDERYGEVPAAMLVTEEQVKLTAEQIQSYLSCHLAKFQIPVKFLFTHQLPLTQNMKIDKKKIRELLSQNR